MDETSLFTSFTKLLMSDTEEEKTFAIASADVAAVFVTVPCEFVKMLDIA